MEWKIFYSNGVVKGASKEDWLTAPDHDVQVVIIKKDPDYRSNRTYKVDGENVMVTGYELIDGIDEYDPFGWGAKYGKLLDIENYMNIWETACGQCRSDADWI